MTVFRGNRPAEPRIDVKPRRTLHGRLKRAWVRQKGFVRNRPVEAIVSFVVVLVLSAMFRHYFPRAYAVAVPAGIALFLLSHWWSNRGAE